jgi:hypothetical protein
MRIRPRVTTRSLYLLVLPLVIAAFGGAAASAQADSPIEGVWSFNGGKVAVTKAPGGGFVGTVVSATKFADCAHPVNEEMWTGITQQSDGSYWGKHQWFFEPPECAPNPTLGLTAWRVLAEGKSKYLLVCFSNPGDGSQPTIAANGLVQSATYGCAKSALVSSVPTLKPADFPRFVNWPGSKSCLGGKKLRIRISDPKNDPIATVAVTGRSGKVVRKAAIKTRPFGRLAVLNIAHLPKPKLTVKVKLTTVLGQSLSKKRHYRLCAAPHKRGKGSGHAKA